MRRAHFALQAIQLRCHWACGWPRKSTKMTIRQTPPETGACRPLRSGVYRGTHRSHLYFEGASQPRGDGPRASECPPGPPGMAPGGRWSPGCAGVQRYAGFAPETHGILGIHPRNTWDSRVSLVANRALGDTKLIGASDEDNAIYGPGPWVCTKWTRPPLKYECDS